MPDADLKFTILRKGRREDEFMVTTDPNDVPGHQAILRNWLSGNRWHPARWSEFEAEVRMAGRNKPLHTVRA